VLESLLIGKEESSKAFNVIIITMRSAQSDGFSIRDLYGTQNVIKEIFIRGSDVRFDVQNGLTRMQNKTFSNQESMLLMVGRNLHMEVNLN